jgi:DNA-directed RNA polymerase beta' subunit
MMDMVIPEEKQDLLSRAQLEINRINTEYQEGAITDGERYNQVIDVWAKTTEKIAGEDARWSLQRNGRRRGSDREGQLHFHDGRFRGPW